MFARTSTWGGTAEAIDKWAAAVETVRPFIASLEGNAGAFFLVDAAGHRALTLTLWKTESAALASDASADQSRARTVAATGVELLERGQYEVIVSPETPLSFAPG
jgi:heme-degrading monooxygenase HmoA